MYEVEPARLYRTGPRGVGCQGMPPRLPSMCSEHTDGKEHRTPEPAFMTAAAASLAVRASTIEVGPFRCAVAETRATLPTARRPEVTAVAESATDEKPWLTLAEAGRVTGHSPDALRSLIRR